MKSEPIVIFLDSDGPIADYDRGANELGMSAVEFKMQPGAYLWLGITPGAKDALKQLKTMQDAGYVDVWIATKTPSKSPYAYTEKVLWYRQHFPWLEDKIVLTHDKSLLRGDYLLDDRPHKANASSFTGTLHVFDVAEPIKSWASFLNLFQEHQK